MSKPIHFSNLPPEVLCTVCKNLARDPKICSECMEGSFCFSCVPKLPQSCPICKTTWTDKSLKSNPILLKLYNSCEIQCPNPQCSWIGKIPLFFNHQLNCEKKILVCEFSKFGCKWTGNVEKDHRQKCVFEPFREFFTLNEEEIKKLKASNVELKQQMINIKEQHNKEIAGLKDEIYLLRPQIIKRKYFGVLKNVSLRQMMNDGFKIGMIELYSEPSVFDDFQKFKEFRLVAVAARKKDDDNLILVGVGKGKKVFKETLSVNKTNFDNGCYWYYMKNKSLGFSNVDKIELECADTVDGEMRISWHLEGSGGYRIGNSKKLNKSAEYEKIILYFDE